MSFLFLYNENRSVVALLVRLILHVYRRTTDGCPCVVAVGFTVGGDVLDAPKKHKMQMKILGSGLNPTVFVRVILSGVKRNRTFSLMSS